MNYWCGSRVTTNFTSITDPAGLDGSTGKVHFFGISLGAGSPQVVQTDTALGSVVTATVGNANSPQVHAGTLRSITPTSPVPAEPDTCMCAAMTTPAQSIQRFTASISPPASCQIRTMEIAVAQDGYRSMLDAHGNLQFRPKHGHGLALRRDTQQLRLQWILHRMRGILQYHFRISGNSSGGRRYQWWNERHRRG